MSLTSPNQRRSWLVTPLLAVALLGAPIAATGQQIQVSLDPSQTKIEWTLDATMHTVHGTFKLKSGVISFDPSTGAASGELVVDATSAESGNSSRDGKMHSDVLESKRYPEITFLPKKVLGKLPKQGASDMQVQGVFHIHGTDHEITISIPIQCNGQVVKATADFTVPYQAWGMKNPSNMILKVADRVEVKVVSTGRLIETGH